METRRISTDGHADLIDQLLVDVGNELVRATSMHGPPARDRSAEGRTEYRETDERIAIRSICVICGQSSFRLTADS